jgi:hypothetical protein
MIRLTELVEKLVDCFDKTRDPDPVIRVLVYLPDGSRPELDVELVGLHDDGAAVQIVALPAPVAAGEPGAGVVADESDVELDVDLLLDVATGDRGCYCQELDAGGFVCKSDGRLSTCRQRLYNEQRDRQREELSECLGTTKR